jgi:hypothetical protein
MGNPPVIENEDNKVTPIYRDYSRRTIHHGRISKGKMFIKGG